MKTINFAMSVLLFSLLSSNINAASIDIETMNFNRNTNGNDLESAWTSQSSTVNTHSISVFNSYRPGRYSINRLTAQFSLGSAVTWGFEAGLDAHYGAEIYLDDGLIGDRVDDLWWSGNWANSDVLSALNNGLTAGEHTLELYWAEACCNGASSMRFTTDGSTWQSLSVENLATASSATHAVPEPLSVWLMSAGLVILMLNRRKQQVLIA